MAIPEPILNPNIQPQQITAAIDSLATIALPQDIFTIPNSYAVVIGSERLIDERYDFIAHKRLAVGNLGNVMVRDAIERAQTAVGLDRDMDGYASYDGKGVAVQGFPYRQNQRVAQTILDTVVWQLPLIKPKRIYNKS